MRICGFQSAIEDRERDLDLQGRKFRIAPLRPPRGLSGKLAHWTGLSSSAPDRILS